LIIPDEVFGEKFYGYSLSEYSQLFGLADYLKEINFTGKFYTFHYRRFNSLKRGSVTSTNYTHAYAVSPQDAPSFFPTEEELLQLGDSLLVGPALNVGTLASNYVRHHCVEDFSAFMISLIKTEGFNEERCKSFINTEILFPAPTIAVNQSNIFFKHMKILKSVWAHFAANFYSKRLGYQTRVGGFLLERLHSFLLYEEIMKENLKIVQGHQIIVSDTQFIPPSN
jgi:hypothetical protein